MIACTQLVPPLNKGTLAIVFQLVGVGWYVAICIIGGLLGGLWLDGKLGMRPVFTLVGLVLGLSMAFYGVYRMLLPLLYGTQAVVEKRDRE